MKRSVLHSTPLRAALGLISGALWAGTNVWTSHGPYGDYIRAIAVDPQNPNTMYATADIHGIFKSMDGGANWRAVNSGLPLQSDYFPYSPPHFTALAVDPQNSGTVYAGASGGLFKSADGGMSWKGVSPPCALSVLAIDPATPSTLYAAGRSGVCKSTDGGATWSAENSPFTNTSSCFGCAIVIDPQTPSTMYAVDPYRGVFRTMDGGESWNLTNPDPTAISTLGVAALAIDPKNPNTLYGSFVENNPHSPGGTIKPGGIFKSTDGGATWRAVNSGLPGEIGQANPNSGGSFDPQLGGALAIDPQDPSTIYLLTCFGCKISGELFKSTDGGANWRAVTSGLPQGLVGSNTPRDTNPQGLTIALAVDPQNSGTVYAGTSGVGMFKSTDGAASWSAINSGLTAMVFTYALAVDPQNGSTVYAEFQYNGGVFKSVDGAMSWGHSSLAYSFVTALAVDPQNPNTVYAQANGVFKSTDGGGSWAWKYGGNGFLVIDPQNPSTLYTAGFKSTDGGESWVPLGSPGLYFTDLAVDPQNPSTLYGGGYWDGVFKSPDGGKSWTFYAPFSTSGNCYDLAFTFDACSIISALAVDPRNPNTVYAQANGVFKSADGGATWAKWSLPGSVFLAIDPQGAVYAKTHTSAIPWGLFKSVDGATTWSPVVTSGLTSGIDVLAIDPQNLNRLYAGTADGVFEITLASQEQ